MVVDPIEEESSGLTVVELFRRSSSLLEFESGGSMTGSDLAARGEQFGAAMAGQGLKRGDRVAIWMSNRLEFVASLLGAAAGGFVAVSVNTRYGLAEVERLLERSGAVLVVTDQLPGPGWPETVSPEQLNVLASESGRNLATGTPNDRFVVFTTSGTTSEPKLVAHRQASVTDHASELGTSWVYRRDDVAMVPMPLCGVFGLTSLLAAVASDCELILIPDRFEANETAAEIAESSVTVLNGSDDMFHRLLATDADLSSIRLGGYARFNTSLDGIVERADKRGMTLTGLYGMSEVQAMFTVRDPSGDAASRQLAGGTITGEASRARVIDGELQLSGPSLFEGYLADGGESIDETLTDLALDDGWFKTGDSAVQPNGDGSRDFTFVARIGDVLRIGGFLVAPAEIESVVMNYGGFDGVQVVALDRPSGARPVAFVVRSDSVVHPDSVVRPEVIVRSAGSPEAIDEEAVKAHCGRTLAKFKVPIRVLMLDEFPMGDGPNGPKVLSAELRRMAAIECGPGSVGQ